MQVRNADTVSPAGVAAVGHNTSPSASSSPSDLARRFPFPPDNTFQGERVTGTQGSKSLLFFLLPLLVL